MDIGTLYSTAKNFADILKQKKPEYVSDPDANLCLIIGSDQEIYSGVTTVSINGGEPEIVPAEYAAALSLASTGAKAVQLIVISFDDYGFFEPEEKAVKLLMHLSMENGNCDVVMSPDETVKAASLLPDGSADFFSGFDDSAAAVGAAPEFASSVNVDSGNPFNEAPGASEPAPQSLYSQPSEAQQMGTSGFNNPYANQQGFPQPGGYPQQQGGYPQQGGFPQANPYYAGGGSSAYQNSPQNAAPYRQAYSGHSSVHIGGAAPVQSAYQGSSVIMPGASGGAFKNRLKKFLGEDAVDTPSADTNTATNMIQGEPANESLSKSEMLKLAKDKKKVAKANLNMKKD